MLEHEREMGDTGKHFGGDLMDEDSLIELQVLLIFLLGIFVGIAIGRLICHMVS